MLNTKMWMARVQERHVLEQVQQMGATTKVLRIKSPSKLVHMRQMWDTETQKAVTGDAVRRVAAQEAQKKNTLPTHSPDLQWVHGHMPVSNSLPAKADKVALGARKLVIQESDDQVAHTLNYPMTYGEGRELTKAQHNTTVAVDGIAAGLAVHAEIAYQSTQSKILLQPVESLPDECTRVLHLPFEKKAGIILNKHTRPIMLGSAIPRSSQKLSLMRCQKYNVPEDLHMVQHAMLKGLNCLHLRRLAYTSVFVQLRRCGEILLMFLDLSNGYGQTDRDLVRKPVDQGSNLKWAWKAAAPVVCQHHSICADCCGPIHGILHPWGAGPRGGGWTHIFIYGTPCS